jgi:hypothetical protein
MELFGTQLRLGVRPFAERNAITGLHLKGNDA